MLYLIDSDTNFQCVKNTESRISGTLYLVVIRKRRVAVRSGMHVRAPHGTSVALGVRVTRGFEVQGRHAGRHRPGGRYRRPNLTRQLPGETTPTGVGEVVGFRVGRGSWWWGRRRMLAVGRVGRRRRVAVQPLARGGRGRERRRTSHHVHSYWRR